MATYSRICQGQRTLVGYSPRGCDESDTAEQLTLSFTGSKEYHPSYLPEMDIKKLLQLGDDKSPLHLF